MGPAREFGRLYMTLQLRKILGILSYKYKLKKKVVSIRIGKKRNQHFSFDLRVQSAHSRLRTLVLTIQFIYNIWLHLNYIFFLG